MKMFVSRRAGLIAAAVATSGALAAPAYATGPDFTSMTSAIDLSTTTTALLAVGVLAVTLTLVVMGIRKILHLIRGA